MAERLKAPVLKTGILQGIGGSNPSPSANDLRGGRPRPPAVFGLADEGSRRGANALYSVGLHRWLASLGEVAESAEGSRLLSGYRGKTSVPGSNPGLSAMCALSSDG